MNKDRDSSSIKRLVVVFPAYYRDSWNQLNMVGNAFSVAKKKFNVDDSSVAIGSLLYLNSDDKKSGSVEDDWVYYEGDNWSVGGMSRGPGNFSLTSFTVTDRFISKLRGDFPNLEKIMVIGHSLGAQTTHRYAITKSDDNDDIMSFWIGNPGSYTYFNSDRPEQVGNCDDVNKFPNGITDTSTLPVSARKRSSDDMTQAFLNRRVHFAQGLNDNGISSGACDSMAQGHNRLERSAFYVQHAAKVNGGSYPDSWTMDYIEGVSHQDYPMFAADANAYRIFVD